jgi:hypothetical protein
MPTDFIELARICLAHSHVTASPDEGRLSTMELPSVTSCLELSLRLLQNFSDIFFTDSRPVLPL